MQTIRLLTKEDISAVHKIETECFAQAWSMASLELLCCKDNFGIVALSEGQVCAYGGMTCVLDEGEVTNIATSPEYRRRGFGRAVLKEMLCEAQKRGLSKVFLEVRESNRAAIALYMGEGFCTCCVRKGFYSHPKEDALQMVYNIKTNLKEEK